MTERSAMTPTASSIPWPSGRPRPQRTDTHGASSTATATVTVIGQNDAPVIQTGGAGDEASYWVRVHETAITTVHATDVDNGDVVKYSIIGGPTRAASQS